MFGLKPPHFNQITIVESSWPNFHIGQLQTKKKYKVQSKDQNAHKRLGSMLRLQLGHKLPPVPSEIIKPRVQPYQPEKSTLI